MKRARPTTRLAAWLFAGAALAHPTTAKADTPTEKQGQAQVLFDQALALMKSGKYAEACPKLQQSQALDPGMGTQYRLAECYESAGLVGSAWLLFTEVAETARKAGRSDREQQARKRADALRPRLPRLTIRVPAALAGLGGLEIRRDGDAVGPADRDRPTPVDPGAHTITVTATGKKPWQQSIRSLEGGTVEITIGPLEDDPSQAAARPPPPPTPPNAPPETPKAQPETPKPQPDAPQPAAGSWWTGGRIGAVVVGVVGLGGVGVGSAFGLVAKGQWNDALGHCRGGNTSRCDSTGISLGKSASGSATASTIGFIGGGVLVAGAVVMLAVLPSPKKAQTGVQLVPVVGPDGAFGLLRGRF